MSDTPAEKSLPAPKKSIGATPGTVAAYVLEILLPTLISGAAVWFLFSYFNFWRAIQASYVLIFFGVAVVAIALLLVIVADSLTTPLRRARRIRFGRGPLARLIKLVLGGLVLPLLVVLGLNFISAPAVGLRAQGTLMNALASAGTQPVRLAPPDAVGAIARQSKNTATRALSIQVLKGFHSSEALNQLILLVKDDRSALADASVAAELSNAIAAYGADARSPLMGVFAAAGGDASSSGASSSTGAASSTGASTLTSADTYSRYFAGAFDALQGEIAANAPDAATREAQLARLQAAQAQLKTAIAGMGDDAAFNPKADPRPDFVLRTFLAMNIQEDADLLAFAKSTAASPRYSSAVRGSALLLVGKLGGKDDLNVLYPYLDEGDPLLQTRALQAIAALQAKLAGK